MQATRIRPDTRPTDLRRLVAAGLSAIIPGLGQLFNRRIGLGALFLPPSLVLLAVGVGLAQLQSPARLVAWVVSPQVMGTLLALNMIVLAWRLLAVGQAFLDTRRTGRTGWLGIIGIAVIAIVVIVPHLAVYRYGTLLGDTFKDVFGGAVQGTNDDPAAAAASASNGQRVNVLLIGVDKRGTRTENLTDTMIVASLDPVGRTVSMASLPRDLVGVPLGDGNTYGPKLNSLMSYADRHPDEFPAGGVRTLEQAIGALLDIKIDYYARIDFAGFIDMVDAVGGVDINVKRAIDAKRYDGYGLDGTGFHLTKGLHHLTGAEALAYARVRKGAGESDFTRAARQQEVIVALRGSLTRGGSLFWRLPDLLEAVSKTVRTDVPTARLPELAAIVDEVGAGDVVRVVIGHPLVKSANTRYGSSLVPDLKAIRAVAADLFTTPGTPPAPWPTAKPTPTPKPTKVPKATPAS